MTDPIPNPAVPDAPPRWLAEAAFVAAILLSAALLFSVEPLVTRLALPRFGGSAAVWSVALVFFQGALLAGYAYAHLVIRYLPPRTGAVLHLLLLALAGAGLPLSLPDTSPQGAGEATHLLGLLVRAIGLPFVALSANAPLLQAWYARSHLRRAHDPYVLYAASNVGSFTALLAYPLVVEPLATLTQQRSLWSFGYAGLVLLIAVAALVARLPAGAPLPQPRVAWSGFARWVYLAAVPSAGLVAVTAHMSTDVAAAPFLWVVPLALYLLTFVLVFSTVGEAMIRGAQALLPVTLAGLAAVVGFQLRFGLLIDALLHLIGFFILALACHGRMATTRPATAGLTAFYLAMSLGGMIGGILAALVAPHVFSFVAEYPLVLIAAAGTIVGRVPRVATAALAVVVLSLGLFWPMAAGKRETHRSFFGVHTIEDTADGQIRTLRHGLEIHGAERLRDGQGRPVTGKPVPLAFYHEDSPISEAIDAVRAAKGGGALRIGVIGLGTGAIACLAELHDSIDFYEIDPVVIDIARNRDKFRYLSECAPRAGIITGDARQTLAQSSATYDMLIVDAFSSDAIPLHLLTREAFTIYRDRVGATGLVLIHISNDHLKLNDIVASTARTLDLEVLINDEEEDPDKRRAFLFQPAVVALARSDAAFGALARSDDWVEPPEEAGVRPWSDDFSNLLAAVLARRAER